MAERTNDVPAVRPTTVGKNQITSQIKKPMTAVHDLDINLGHALEVADAPNWGRDINVSPRQLAEAQTPGASKGGVSGEPGSANAGVNYGAASNSGDNSGLTSTGTSSQTGIPTDTGRGIRRSGAASTESNSADANKQ